MRALFGQNFSGPGAHNCIHVGGVGKQKHLFPCVKALKSVIGPKCCGADSLGESAFLVEQKQEAADL